MSDPNLERRTQTVNNLQASHFYIISSLPRCHRNLHQIYPLIPASQISMPSIPQHIAAGAAGVLIHHSIFIYGEWHLHATKLLGLHAIAYAGFILLEAFHRNISWLAALTVSSQIFSIYTLCLLASISIYRVFFHRLRGFPGPVLASVSKLWHVAQCLDSKNHILLEKLHQEYGDFVRTGMTTMAVGFWRLIGYRTQ